MLYREVIAVCSQIHTKHQNVRFVNVKLVARKVNLKLWKFMLFGSIMFACWRYPQIHKELKQPLYWPWEVVSVPGGWGNLITRLLAYKYCKVVSPTHRPPLPQPKEIFLALISVGSILDTRTIMRPEGNCQWKNPIDIIRNRTRFLLACNAVPITSPSAPP